MGQLISSILMKVIEKEEAPATPADSEYIGSVYQIGPEGATFDPAIDLTIKYDESKIPEGVAEKNLVVATFDKSTDQWVDLDSTVHLEDDKVTAKVSHFTAFTILAHTSPASFTITDLAVTPSEVNIGESVSISVLVTNTGDLTGSYEVSLKIDDMVMQTKEVILDGGSSETISFSLTPDTAGEYVINISGLLGTGQVKAPKAPAAFTISTITITPTEVNIGESVTISVIVTNTGDLTGSYKVSLKIDNILEETKEITLDGGESQKIVFTVAKESTGTCKVEVDGLSDSFVVKEEIPPVAEEEISITPAPVPTPTPEPTPTPVVPNWGLIGGIIIGVVTTGLLSYFLVRKRRKAKG